MRQRLWNAGWLLLLAMAFAPLFSGETARAQDEPPALAEGGPDASSDDVSTQSDAPAATPEVDALPFEIQPKVFYVKDRDGKLQAIPGMTYEQLMEAWKQEHQLAEVNQRPAYSLERLSITGNASANNAELLVHLKLIVHDEGWTGVPLRFNQAVLREDSQYNGPGKQVMHVDPDGEGHVAWIQSEEDQTHELTLKLVAPIEQLGPQSRLKLSVPRAAVAELQLQVPLGKAEAEVSEGSTLETVRPLAGGKTELRVLGLGGDFELTWHPADSNVASLPTILEANTTQLVRINGRSANTEVKLTVRSLGSEFDHFQVRLPPGADYIGTPEAGVSLVAVDASAADGKLYDVRLEKKTTGPVEVRLVTERAHNAAQDDSVLELAGFDVVGAVRQWGTIAVQVEGNWQVVWGESDHVRAVDDVEANVRRDELAAGFEYFVQPYSLTARVVPQKTRIRVEPTYTLLVSSEDVRLQAKLKYIIRGAKVRTLTVDLPGWEVDSVGPASLINVDTAIAEVDETLGIPLLQATSGELELTFEARHRLAPDSKEIRLDLPRPQGDVTAADVAVVSDDPIELLPRLEELRHLAPQLTRPTMVLPQRQQEPLYYRTTGDAARFVADFKLHEQEISSTLSSNVNVRETTTDVEQSIAYQIAYYPTDHFTLIVPAAIRPERMIVMHEGQRIAPVATKSRSDGNAVPVRVDLPRPAIGRCELQISYSTAHDRPPTQASALVTVPLVVPGEGDLSDNQLQVTAERQVSVSYPQGPWTSEGSASTGSTTGVDGQATLDLSAPRAIGEVTLAVSSKQRPATTSTTVERALIETRLTSRVRQDRALFRIATDRQRLDVTLPEGAEQRTLAVSVDGLRVTPDAVVKRVVTIPLPNGRRDHLLELRYHFADRGNPGSLRLEGPQIATARWAQQLYWELSLPADEHVLSAPRNYTEELSWRWADYFWQREPTVAPQDLLRWVNVAQQSELSPFDVDRAADENAGTATTNRYLFSTVGTVEPLTLYTLSRARLVLLGSLPILVLGLVLIYFPASRHPAVLLVLAVAVATTGFIAPQLAILLAQAALLGLVLLTLAAFLAYLMPRAVAPPVAPARGSSYAIIERSVTELYHRSPASGSHPASTATNPLVPTSGEGDS